MEASGFDVVRLPIAWSALEPQRGHFSTAYLDRVAADVALLNAHHLYVVLDMHFLGWSPGYGGSGAPAWATLSWIPDIPWGPMPSVTRLLSPAINASTAYFWLTSDWQTQYLRTWQFVAARFRDDSGVAGYDIINEPHAFPLPPLRFDKDDLFPFYARAITSIGAVDPNHLFLIENDALGDLPTSVVALSAPDLVYSPHVYTGVLFPPTFDGNPQSLDTHVDELAREAGQVPAAMWVGEFGISTRSPRCDGVDRRRPRRLRRSRRRLGVVAVASTGPLERAQPRWQDPRHEPAPGAGPPLPRRRPRRGVGRLRATGSPDGWWSPSPPATLRASSRWPGRTSPWGSPRSARAARLSPLWDPSSSRLSLTVPVGMACRIELSAP